MKHLLALLILAGCVAGCSKGDAAEDPVSSTNAPTQLPPGQGGGGSGGITPMTPGGAIPNAPISGTDSVLGAGGGGSGVGQAMKGRAKDIAAGGGPNSLNNVAPPDGEEDPGDDGQ